MDVNAFQTLLARVTGEIAGAPLDARLEARLNEEHGAGSATYEALSAACRAGVRDGWLCNRESGAIRYGRALAASAATHGFSVDVVDMADIAGPLHAHPNGEIDLIIPLGGAALFDGRPAGWCVYEAGSRHRPTVTRGRALVLYLLPDGAIDFAIPAN